MSFADKFRRSLKRWFRVFMILFSLATVCIAAGFGVLIGVIRNLPPIEELENYQPPQLTKILDRSGQRQIGSFVAEYGDRELVTLKDCPDYLADAFIAIEDERFRQHFGIDLKAVLRATKVNIQARSFSQGFSTLTQQLPRNIMTNVGREKKLKRKIKECLLALQIEKRYSKDQILEFYINQVFLGNNSYGVKAAARNYFNKDLQELTLAECALLAGLPQSPSEHNPRKNPAAAERRRNAVLKRMRVNDIITQQQFDAAVAEPIRLQSPSPTYRIAPYFVEHLRNELVRDPAFDNEELQRSGYTIKSTLDVSVQQIVAEELDKGLREVEKMWQEKKVGYLGRFYVEQRELRDVPLEPGKHRLGSIQALTSASLRATIPDYSAGIDYHATVSLPATLPYYDPKPVMQVGGKIDIELLEVDHQRRTVKGKLFDGKRVQGAVVVLDASNGDILALSGGADFFDRRHDGQWNRAIQAPRQPGSCFKPFVFAAAMGRGYTPGSIIIDEPLHFNGGYSPQNFENEHFGPTTLREALEHSRNVPTIMLYEALGRGSTNRFISHFDFNPNVRPWVLRPEAPTCLGNTSINLLELGAAYVPFINRGILLSPRCVTAIHNANDVLEKKFAPGERRVLSEQDAYLVASMLQGVMLEGTGSRIARQFSELEGVPEMGGKTGTTDDCVDAWFVGFTPQIVVGVWVGFDRVRSLGTEMTGAKVAGPIWTGIMRRLIESDSQWMKVKKFSVPEDIVFRDIDRVNGLLVTKETPSKYIMSHVAFKKGTQPTEFTPLLPNEYTTDPTGVH